MLSKLGPRSICHLVSAIACVAALVGGTAYAATAAAHRPHQSKLQGKWTNPVGACVQHVIKFDPATGDLKCTGTSKWTGTWTGSTTWTFTGNQDVATGDVSGRIDEVFTGHSVKGHKQSRKGKLTFVEKMTITGSAIEIRGHIVKSSRGLAGSSGHATWTGTTNTADGSGHGPYTGRWHQGKGHS